MSSTALVGFTVHEFSFQNVVLTSLFPEIWWEFSHCQTGRDISQKVKTHKVNLYNLCQSKPERFIPAVKADNQNEGKINFPPSLAVIWWPRSFPPRSFTSYKLYNVYLCIHREIIRWERNVFHLLDHHFHPNFTIKNPFCSLSFPVSWWGQICHGRELQLAMSRTNTFALIQLTWNVTDYSDEASDILPISSSLKGHISFLLAYITSLNAKLNLKFWGTQTLLFWCFTSTLPLYSGGDLGQQITVIASATVAFFCFFKADFSIFW